MPVTPSEGASWGFVQWMLTLLSTFAVSAGAFLWRLLLRLEKLDDAQARQRIEFEAARASGEAAMLRLAERFGQIHEDHFRLRETIGALPTRSDLRDLEDWLAERLTSLSDRLDRAVDT